MAASKRPPLARAARIAVALALFSAAIVPGRAAEQAAVKVEPVWQSQPAPLDWGDQESIAPGDEWTDGAFIADGDGACWDCRAPRGFFYFTADLVTLARETDEDRVFATLGTPTADVLNANDLDSGLEPGMRVLIGARITQCWAIEGSFMRFANWDESQSVTDVTPNQFGTPGNLFSPFSGFGSPPVIGLDFNTFASIRLISGFETAEWNFRQTLSEPFGTATASLLYGFRYARLQERFDYRTVSTVTPPNDIVNALDVDLDNHQYGLQIGGSLEYCFAPWWLQLEGKVALCHNGVVQESTFQTTRPAIAPGAPVELVREFGNTAFIADFSAALEIHLGTCWLGRLGYQLLLVDGVSLGTNNFTATIVDDDHALFHGPFAGLTFFW